MDTRSLDDRVVIITGGASGIGRSVAQAVTAAGGSAVICDRNEAMLNLTAKELRSTGGNVVSQLCDVTSASDIARLVEAADRAFGRIDGLVTSAGIVPTPMPALKVSAQHLQALLEVNVIGTLMCATAAARYMLDKGRPGSIVTIASMLAFTGGPGQSPYAATKSAVVALTKNMALEWGPSGIRVNAIAPGIIKTRTLNGDTVPEERQKVVLARTPLGRFGEPEDVADVAHFLLADASRYMTGQTLHVNGGVGMF